MEVFNITNTSQDHSYNNSNITTDYNKNSTIADEYERKVKSIMFVVECIIISVGLPLTLVAIYALRSMVRGNHVAPIYVINLLISDLIQFCCMIVEMGTQIRSPIKAFLHVLSGCASVGFMVCIALERYLVIAFPLWYRFRRTIKISVAVSVAVWVITLAFVLPMSFWVNKTVWKIFIGVFFLLPFPLLIFFLGGTIRALSASRVSSDEKRRIVGVLVLVLLIYTLLFLPTVISLLAKEYALGDWNLRYLSYAFRRVNPLADLLLYIFMRKGIVDKLLVAVCCCRMNSNFSSRMESTEVCSSSV